MTLYPVSTAFIVTPIFSVALRFQREFNLCKRLLVQLPCGDVGLGRGRRRCGRLGGLIPVVSGGRATTTIEETMIRNTKMAKECVRVS